MISDYNVALLLLALCSLSLHISVQAFSIEGLIAVIPGLKALFEAMCPFVYLACAVSDHAEKFVANNDLFPSEMLLKLDEESAGRKYPAFPHTPLLVAARTCDAVVVRWRSFETLLWPVERFVLQRYPGRENQPQWSTLLDENLSEFVDLDVQSGHRYGYRVQAICRDNATSAYEYQWTGVDRVKNGRSAWCRSSNALLGSVGTLNPEGLRSLGLIFTCFLTVYGLMRANVIGTQGTQSRSCRLKRIKKSSQGITCAVSTSMCPRRSSTSTFSSSPSVVVDPGQRGCMLDAIRSSTTAMVRDLTRAQSSMDNLSRQESAQTSIPSTFQPISRYISVINEKATGCEHCGKRFRIFRKRYMCDICHSVSLCRKCGFQASVDSFANARTGTQMHSVGNTRASIGGCGMVRRRLSLSQHHQKKLKIRTICRKCCDDVYCCSTHASVRPSC